MVSTTTVGKNIWVAASDGDIDRVKGLVESGQSPNDKDSNSYTPMHAAASYAHLELLTYLLSISGNINITDDEGDTPLFTVETMEAARFLVDHGADIQWRNEAGQTAAEYLEEDHPEIAAYLSSLNPHQSPVEPAGPSALAMDQFANLQTSVLLEETQRIMQEAEEKGEEPDERLREVVERAVREGLVWGQAPTQGPSTETEEKRRKS